MNLNVFFLVVFLSLTCQPLAVRGAFAGESQSERACTIEVSHLLNNLRDKIKILEIERQNLAQGSKKDIKDELGATISYEHGRRLRFLENKVNELKKEKAALLKNVAMLKDPEAFIDDEYEDNESSADDLGNENEAPAASPPKTEEQKGPIPLPVMETACTPCKTCSKESASGSMSMQDAEDVAKHALKTIETLEARNALLMQENDTLRSQKECEQLKQPQIGASIPGMVCTKIKQ